MFFSCNNQESSSVTVGDLNEVKSGSNSNDLSFELQEKAKSRLNGIKPISLPFRTSFVGKKNSEIANLLKKKGSPNVLDSVFKSSDLEQSWFYEDGFTSGSENLCEFIGRLESPYTNYEILLYSIKDRVKYYSDYTPIYLLVVDKETFALVSSSHIGIAYLKDKPNYTSDNGYSSAEFSIDLDLNIRTEIKDYVSESVSPYYYKEQYLTSDGQFKYSPTTLYSYDYPFYGSNSYFYYKVEDSLMISTYDDNAYEEDFIYHHLDISRADKKPILDGSAEQLEIKDHTGRPWLDLFKYEQSVENSSCSLMYGSCNNAHYINYCYNSLEDTIPVQVFEVEYTHLTEGRLKIKTRYANSYKDLLKKDFRVITLVHTIPYDYENDNNEKFREVNSKRWEYDFYFKHEGELPYKVTIEKREKTIEEEELEAYLKEVDHKIQGIFQTEFKGERLSTLNPVNLPLPNTFLESQSIDGLFEVLSIPKSKKDSVIKFCILKNKRKNTYYLVKYKWKQSQLGQVLSMQSLPANKPLYSTTEGLSQITEDETKVSFDLYEKKWLFYTANRIVETKEERIKEVRFRNDDKNDVIKIVDHLNEVSFQNINQVIPNVIGNQKLFTDLKNRPRIEIKSFVKGKSARYLRYYYHSDKEVAAYKVLDVKYVINDEGIVQLEFRSAPSENELTTFPFISTEIYPKEHKKYKPWKFTYFNVNSLKELKKVQKK